MMRHVSKVILVLMIAVASACGQSVGSEKNRPFTKNARILHGLDFNVPTWASNQERVLVCWLVQNNRQMGPQVAVGQFKTNLRAIGPSMQLNASRNVAAPPSIAWNHSLKEFGLLWRENRSLIFQKLNGAGRPLSPSRKINLPPTFEVSEQLIWNNSHYSFLINRERVPAIFFTQLDGEGNLARSSIKLPGFFDSRVGSFALAKMDDSFGIFYSTRDQRRPIYKLNFVRLILKGNKPDMHLYEVKRAGEPFRNVQVVSSLRGYVLAWEERRKSQIVIASLNVNQRGDYRELARFFGEFPRIVASNANIFVTYKRRNSVLFRELKYSLNQARLGVPAIILNQEISEAPHKEIGKPTVISYKNSRIVMWYDGRNRSREFYDLMYTIRE